MTTPRKTLKLSGKVRVIPLRDFAVTLNDGGDGHDPDRRPLIDDRIMENKDESLGVIFIKCYPTAKGDDLVFICERLIFVDETTGNRPLGVESFRAASFSEWFAKKVREGWRVAE